MKNIQEVVAIIDRSGSMSGKEDDTIGGINSTFDILKNENTENDEIKVSVKLFDHEEYLLFRSINIKDVRPLSKEDYRPRGQTALLDAIGNTISFFMEKKILDNSIFTSCLIYIVTDGYENASSTFTKDKIKDMIKEAEDNYNIKIIYLAANQDAIFEASKYGISMENALNYDETNQNCISAYRSAASVANRQRSGASMSFTQAERNASITHSPEPIRASHSYEPPPLRRQKTEITRN